MPSPKSPNQNRKPSGGTACDCNCHDHQWCYNMKHLADDMHTNIDTAQKHLTEHADKLNAVHTDMARKLMESHATHVNDLNREYLADVHQARENSRVMLNKLVNVEAEEAAGIEKILNEPFMAAIKAAVADAVLKAVGAEQEAQTKAAKK